MIACLERITLISVFCFTAVFPVAAQDQSHKGQAQLPKEILASLPLPKIKLSLCKGKHKDGLIICPQARKLEAKVYITLGHLAKHYLHRGMSMTTVKNLFGVPPGTSNSPNNRQSWKDIQNGKNVDMWVYYYSLSGTDAWALVFASGCLDYIGIGMIGMIPALYGRPGTYPSALYGVPGINLSPGEIPPYSEACKRKLSKSH